MYRALAVLRYQSNRLPVAFAALILALAGGVLLVGLAVAVGAFFGGVGALAAVGAVLAAIMLAVSTIDVPLQGPIGDRSERPLSVADLDEEYRQSIGRMTLDLTELALPEGRTEITRECRHR